MTGGELTYNDAQDVKSQAVENYKNIKPEKEMSSKELNDAIKAEFENVFMEDKQETNDGVEKRGLSEEDRIKIKEETNWSDEIIDHIEDMDQYEIYKNADLHEEEIDGRTCLVKEIDPDYFDPKSEMTNSKRMENGWSPIDAKTGEKIELHHMGQGFDAPFAELCENSEHGDGNHSILHTHVGDSWRQDPDLKYQYNNVDKPNHWTERAKEE